jgi:hypothetical protein
VHGRKQLLADGTIPAAFKVTESTVTSKGVIIVELQFSQNYQIDGFSGLQ